MNAGAQQYADPQYKWVPHFWPVLPEVGIATVDVCLWLSAARKCSEGSYQGTTLVVSL